MTAFTTEIEVRFNHVDAAGIVFYPRYFEMLNQVVEDWFRLGLGVSFAELHRSGRGIPLGEVTSRFKKPSRLGDFLQFELRVLELGGKWVKVRITARCGEEERLRAELMLFYISNEGNGEVIASAPFPAAMAQTILSFK